MVASVRDQANTWRLQADGSYRPIAGKKRRKLFSAHGYFMKNPSLSATQLEKIIWNDPYRWKTKQGPGSVTSCADQSMTKFAWEYNLALYRADDDIKPVSWDGSERDDGPRTVAVL